ncbi:hypothetical protein WA026_011600 [Henosepilachna vigintioctopunctata]|uniref:Uncharacterized protein n=1 Tax=Henosepilachna vigintioctopunctata TaxID=420089 RepID=A0AAW1TRN0_9CUCU
MGTESGCIYILKTTDDEKHCDNKHRSFSIGADTSNATSSNNVAGFWNSWESINTIRSKFDKGRTSRSVRVNSVGKMFGTKLSCSTSSKIGRECFPDDVIGNCEINRGYREVQQLGDTPSSNSYTDLQSYSNELENGKRQLYRRNLSGNCGTNRIYPERQQSESTPTSSSSCGDIASSSNQSENSQIQLYQRNVNGNYGTNRIYPERQQLEITPSSSSSCGDISSPNKSESGQIQLYQRNVNGNYGTNRICPETQQLEITPSSSSSCGDISSLNKSESGQIQLHQRNVNGNYGTNRIYQTNRICPETQQLEITPSSSSSCGDIASSSNKSENSKIRLYQRNVNGNYGTNRIYPERQQLEITPSSSSSSCGDIPSSNKSENGQTQLYQRNLNGNYGTNRIYPERQQSKITPSTSSSCGDIPSSNKSENGQIHLYQGNFVDALPSTSISHRSRTKRSVNGDGYMNPLKDSVQCHETLDLCESKSETSRSKHIRNIEQIISVNGKFECSTNSGNESEKSEKQLLTKVERSSKGAVPKVSPTSTFERQEDLQHHNQKHNKLPGEKGNGLDLKNMPAAVSVKRNINHTIGKDTGDNGCSFLNLTPPANLLATIEGRLKTYKNWPNKNIDPQKLAAAGFFYSGKTDIVECFKCGIKGHNWLLNDDPMEDHKKWNRNCSFVRENAPEENNVPQTGTGSDYCGNLDIVTSQYTVSEEPGDYYRNLGVDISPFLQTGAKTNQSEVITWRGCY